MFLSPSDVKSITDRLLARSNAESCSIAIEGGEEQSLRFAHNSATTNAATETVRVRITSHIGARTGSVATTSLDDGALEQAMARSEEIARLMPGDPEFMAPLGPQTYAETARYDEAVGGLGLGFLADAAASAIAEGALRQVEMFGYGASGRRSEALATSAGLFAYDRASEVDFAATARNQTDTWSGWAGASEFVAAKLDARRVGRRAADKAARHTVPLDLEPGRYTVVLEPAATAELMRWLMSMMNARTADEGRSFFSRKGGGARLGEALLHPKLTVRSDPRDKIAPEAAFGAEGLPQRAKNWIEKGVVTSLFRSRYWADKTGQQPVPSAKSFTIEGGETSLDEMIGATRRGILVTRLWYTNLVDPRSLLLTGLTRDGNFLIERGRISAPARNLRFNESLATVFSGIVALGPSERTWRHMSRGAAVSAPPMLVEGFNFSSKSSGI
ncbi:MAG: TldD/PmbA family protein [Methylocystis sp.]|nr:TldD/PmbA family protein [Methylocystis sp.]